VAGGVDVVSLVALVVYAIVRSLVRGVTPFVRRSPWVVDGRAEAVPFVATLTIALLVDLITMLSGHAVVGFGPGPTTASLIALVVLGALGVVAMARRGFAVVAVRDEDFRAAVEAALRAGGYSYDVRVDGRETVDRVVLGDRWRGVEIVARSAHGEGTVRAVNDASRVVVEEIVQHMRARFRSDAVEPHRPHAAGDVAFGLALVAMWVVVF